MTSAHDSRSDISAGFTAAERKAMKERAKEAKAAGTRADDAKDALGKIAEMSEPDRGLAERIHTLITSTVPELAPKTWYGMPAYALDGKMICFFKPAEKFKARYATLGFSDAAALDEGGLWPTEFAVTELTEDIESRIVALVKKATR